MQKLIERPIYLNQLTAFKDTQIIKVITGIRRCGKSTLFDLYCEYLKSIGVEEQQIIRMNFEDPDLGEIDNDKKMYQVIKEKLAEHVMNYIFLDEVQNVPHFQKAVNGLFIKKTVICILPVPMHIFCRESWRLCYPGDMWRSKCFHFHIKNMFQHFLTAQI